MHDRVAAYQEKVNRLIGDDDSLDADLVDQLTFSYSDIFSDGFVCSTIHQANQGDVRRRNRDDGANFSTLGQLCVVSFYDFWEEYLRREYVIAKGKLDRSERNPEVIAKNCRQHASHDLWGDIHHIRISIVHNLGVAVSDIERCQLIRWFRPGDPILLPPERMRAIFMSLLTYRNELHAQQFPEHYIQLS